MSEPAIHAPRSHAAEVSPVTSYDWSDLATTGAVLSIVLHDGIDLTAYEHAELVVRVHAVDLDTNGHALVAVEAISRAREDPGVIFSAGDIATVELPDAAPVEVSRALPHELPDEVRVHLRLWHTSASPSATISVALRLFAPRETGALR